MHQQDSPVRRAQHFYTPPPSQRPGAWDAVPAAERVWRWYEQQMQRRVAPPPGTLIGASVYARINHGRWVADCVCGSAQVVTPDDPRFACPECGYGWVQVTFPSNPAAAEAEVSARPPHERNWWHPDDAVSRDRPRPPVPAKDPGSQPTDPDPEGNPPEVSPANPRGGLSR